MSKHKEGEPVELDTDVITGALRAVCNASVAIHAFTHQKNYWPAINQLMIGLYELHENLTGNLDAFDTMKSYQDLFQACSDLVDGFEEIDIQRIEEKNCCVFYWGESTEEERYAFYKKRFPYDRELNPEDESEDEPDASEG